MKHEHMIDVHPSSGEISLIDNQPRSAGDMRYYLQVSDSQGQAVSWLQLRHNISALIDFANANVDFGFRVLLTPRFDTKRYIASFEQEELPYNIRLPFGLTSHPSTTRVLCDRTISSQQIEDYSGFTKHRDTLLTPCRQLANTLRRKGFCSTSIDGDTGSSFIEKLHAFHNANVLLTKKITQEDRQLAAIYGMEVTQRRGRHD